MNLAALVLAVVPNVVIVMTDDLSHGTLNDAIAHNWMPNLKASVIDQGLTFANSFVGDSLCCPSRATLLSGQYSHNHGVRTNVLPGGGVTLFNDASTMATWLQAAGYRTGLVGKYLNGYGGNLTGSPKDDPTYIPPGWDDWQATTVPDKMFNYTVNDNGVLVAYGAAPADYQTDVLALRAVDFITEAEANDAQPFFLLVTPQAPHQETGFVCSLNVGSIGPLAPAPRHAGMTATLPLPQGPSFNETNVVDKPAWIDGVFGLLTQGQQNCLRTSHRNRVGSMLAVDDLVGVLLAALTTNGELADTLIVFTSDNGFLLGEHRVSAKQQAFEEAIRVPLYVRGPGVPLGTAHQLVLNVDLAPTITELAQATAALTQDGRSLVPVLQDPAFGPWRTHFLVEHQKAGGNLVPPTYAAVRSATHKWVDYAPLVDRELYDLVADASEMTSQHENPAYVSVKQALKLALVGLKACAGSSCWIQ